MKTLKDCKLIYKSKPDNKSADLSSDLLRFLADRAKPKSLQIKVQRKTNI